MRMGYINSTLSSEELTAAVCTFLTLDSVMVRVMEVRLLED